MANNTFVLTKDLEQLTDEERKLHLENVCGSLSLDPKAGLLKYAKLDKGDGSGERHLVLYATKGATDKLRDIHGVDVIEMTDKVIGGAIVYTAKGKNKAGRIDIAVGAAAMENKHGENLAKSFAIAQTRASRRLTLQFSGSGLIDESEVSDNTTSIANAPVPLEEIGAPVPSAASGVDVTGLTVKLPPNNVIEITKDEPARIPNPAAGLKVVDVVAGTGKAKVEEVRAMAAEATALTQTAAVSTQEAEVEAPKVRRKRRTKAEMEAARVTEDPKQESIAAEAAVVASQPVKESTPSEPVEVDGGKAPTVSAAAPTPAPASEAKVTVPLIGDKPTGDQTTAYTARLIEVTNRLEKEGGLLPANGMGPRRKIREFMKIINAGNDLTALTNPQWENSFRYFDATMAEKGCKGLVAIIEYNLEQVNELQPA